MALATFGPETGVSLIGYRGTGKSSVGKILARRLGRLFVDSDAELETRTGRTIAAIFAEDGEPVFRDHEEALILDLVATRPGLILATGGGVILRQAATEAIRAYGIVIWLTAPAEELAQRIRADRRGLAARPSLTGAGTLGEIEEILNARTPLYREAADLMIDTVGKSAGQVVEAIIRNWPEVER